MAKHNFQQLLFQSSVSYEQKCSQNRVIRIWISEGCSCCFAGHGTKWDPGHEPAQSPQYPPTLWSLWGQESSCADPGVVSSVILFKQWLKCSMAYEITEIIVFLIQCGGRRVVWENRGWELSADWSGCYGVCETDLWGCPVHAPDVCTSPGPQGNR